MNQDGKALNPSWKISRAVSMAGTDPGDGPLQRPTKTNGKVRRNLRIALLAVFVSQSYGTPVCGAVRVEGALQLFAHPAHTNVAPFRSLDFILTREGCWWDVLLTNYIYREHEGPLAINYSTDCNDTKTVTFWTKKAIEAEQLRETKKSPHLSSSYKNPTTETVDVSNGSHPRKREPAEIVPWIGFCLPLEIKPDVEGLLPNVLSSLAWPTNQLRCLLEVNAASGSAKRVTLWKPGVAMRQNSDRKFEAVKLPAPFDVGYVGLLYEVTSWDENNMPKTFIQTTYTAEVKGRVLTVMPTTVVLGRIRSITVVENQLNRNVTASAVIVDRRTNISSSSLAYKSSEFGLLSPKDPELTNKVALISQAMLSNGNVSKAGSSRNPLFYYILLLTLVFPLVVFLFTRKKNPERKISL